VLAVRPNVHAVDERLGGACGRSAGCGWVRGRRHDGRCRGGVALMTITNDVSSNASALGVLPEVRDHGRDSVPSWHCLQPRIKPCAHLRFPGDIEQSWRHKGVIVSQNITGRFGRGALTQVVCHTNHLISEFDV
jgi:hypothetical protein